ncbi:lipase/esterase family protein [Pyricularia oryzae Y34]|uniref:Lipase/esterase family protein n=2 Tax=Pyricularia oryzae TaxID=318829 RepID=A0AA97P166_PYRO3|nr:lipase/esterase family protein [Pyricularia oryzae Y34]
MNMNTATVSLAVTPTVVSTFVTHFLNRKPLRKRPTAHLPYDEGLHLIKAFLEFASKHTVEELQAFTAQWVPHPQWVKVEEINIPEPQSLRAASLIEEQLGPEGIRAVGGTKWWQWRKPNSPLRAEWIEMRSDYRRRKGDTQPCKRIMLYVHGGAYFFGSVDEHRYQIQRHARKLKARVIAPRYRLAPQFPFPCGIQDCLATYLYLLEAGHTPNTIILAGDSAGGGMVLSVLVTLRDRGIALPAGAVLISPWVDLTHSFPSVAIPADLDYVPQYGFHHKPSESWPPPNTEDVRKMKAARAGSSGESEKAAEDNQTRLSVTINGKSVQVEEQIQMYTTNDLLKHPLVSPIMQPTLGGLPPLFIMTGGGEVLRDEQIYLAHKCANPSKYMPPESLLTDADRALIEHYKPTDVQLQVWDDMCHVAPTLSFTRPAKFMYRSIAQFGAWALARAQRTEIDILVDDDVSVISSSSESGGENGRSGSLNAHGENSSLTKDKPGRIGKAGDPLPHFQDHMIRQRVDRHGHVYPLAPASELPGCCMDRDLVGIAKEGPVSKWLEANNRFAKKYSNAAKKVQKKRMKQAEAGFESFGVGEHPPPSALAGRRRIGADLSEKKKTRSMGLSLWSLWGSKHDELTVSREEKADSPETKAPAPEEGTGARKFSELQRQEGASSTQSPSQQGVAAAKEDNQASGGHEPAEAEATPVANLIAQRREKEAEAAGGSGLLAVPDAATGATGKRPTVDGISVPFSLNKEAETASMMTLTSVMDAGAAPGQSARPMSPTTTSSIKDLNNAQRSRPTTSENVGTAVADGTTLNAKDQAGPPEDNTLASPGIYETPMSSPNLDGRPQLEKFITADEGLPRHH